MSKDINWLKEQMNMPFTSIGERFTAGHKAAVTKFNMLISQVKQPGLPVIPWYVAKWIEVNKGSINLRGVFSIFEDENDLRYDQKVDDWLCYIDNHGNPVWNDEVLARAWIEGYTVEEKKYVVNIEGSVILAKFGVDSDVLAYDSRAEYDDEYIKEITEREIKAYDSRYWEFAKPVEDVEEDKDE